MRLPVGALAEAKAAYRAVVVGSGYGGGAAACRLAQAGWSVAVLERGDAYEPGDFPDGASGAARQIQLHRLGRPRIGSARALLDFRVSKDVVTLVGCGVGGTSLVNANVALRAEAHVLAGPRWPAALQVPGALDQGYAAAEALLAPAPYPDRWPEPRKRAALAAAAAALGEPTANLPLYVSFERRTDHGVTHVPCTGCGDCVTGCNVGAKRTVDRTYLAAAVAAGAEVIAGAEVSHVRRDGERWVVSARPPGACWPEVEVRADVVVLAAGALGSTEILARSRNRGLWVSCQLGRSVSGNGDHLAYGYDTDPPVNGIGQGHEVDPARPVGPCIVGGIHLRLDGEDILVEDGSLPRPMARLAPLGMYALALRQRARSLHSVRDLWRRPRAGRPANKTLVMLAMGVDADGGRITLPVAGDERRSVLTWSGAARQVTQQRKEAVCRQLVRAIGGTYLRSPVPDHFITVHPLGGAAMADGPDGGVVDDRGRVFAGADGAVHRGLYVMDGAVIPAPVGANPSLTIAALAERATALLLAEEATA
jgi:cholesterol oxidase